MATHTLNVRKGRHVLTIKPFWKVIHDNDWQSIEGQAEPVQQPGEAGHHHEDEATIKEGRLHRKTGWKNSPTD